MGSKVQQPERYNKPAKLFFTLAFSWSLAFWLATVFLGGIEQVPGSLLFYVAGAGPIFAALAVVHLGEEPLVQRSFWRRTFDPRLMSWNWLLVALIAHPLLVAFAVTIDVLMGAEIQLRRNDLTSLWSWLGLIAFVFVFGPLPEEMAWRGVALDRMQIAMTPMMASLVLGTAWAVWHVPLFCIEGTFQHQLGIGSTRFWIFLGTMLPVSVIMTWVYNNTGRSILSAVLVHFSGNLCGTLLFKTYQLAALELTTLTIAAVLIWLRWRDLGFSVQENIDPERPLFAEAPKSPS
ncbi:MAG: CPBP family intramembrane metalloprotease [Pseudomonadales bacterium]|nr:CPBP family intramembrane metalloprotease [Pseudomonadales bacterium]